MNMQVTAPPLAAGREGARRFNMPLGERALALESYDQATRTVELVLATETRVRASGWRLGLDCEWYWEVLDCRAGSVDFSEVEAGNAPLLDAHNRWTVRDQLGKLASARAEGGKVIAVAALGQSEAARAVEAEIAGGTPPKVSAGFRRDEMILESIEDDVPVYRVTKWTLCEGSFVPIAADPNAGVRSAEIIHPCTIMETRAMTQNTNAGASAPEGGEAATTNNNNTAAAPGATSGQEGQRAAAPEAGRPVTARFTASSALALVEEARAFGDAVVTRANEVIAQNERGEIGVEAARAAVLTSAAEAQRAATGGISTGGRAIEAGADERDKFRQGAMNSIIQRAGLTDMVRAADKIRGVTSDMDPGEFRGVRNAELARMSLERCGQRVTSWDRDQVVADALTLRMGPFQSSSDFPILLEGVLHRTLQAAFTVTPDTWRRFAGVGSVTDFRPHSRILRGTFGRLDRLNENGEIKNKPIPDGAKESIEISTRANIVGLTRQAIVNDDLGAFNQVTTDLGRAAKLSIEIDVYELLAQNGGLGPIMSDGKTLFHADHGNIAAVGAPPSIAAFEAVDILMSNQKDVSGNEFVEITPAVWVGSRGLRGEALVTNDSQYDTDTAGKFQKPNRVRGMFSDIVGSPRIAGARWYAFADPATAPAIEVAFLNGEQEPRTEQKDGWRVDGTEFRVIFDYGVGGLNWRSAATNAGQ